MPTQADPPRAIDHTQRNEALFIMVFAAAMFAITYTFDTVPPILAQGIQPTVFPRAILAIMFGLAALQAARAMRLSPGSVLQASKPVPLIVFLTAALLIGFALAIPRIGTFPALILFLPALSLLWGERRWLLMALSFAGFVGFAYLLFRVVMNVPLP